MDKEICGVYNTAIVAIHKELGKLQLELFQLKLTNAVKAANKQKKKDKQIEALVASIRVELSACKRHSVVKEKLEELEALLDL